VAKLDHLSVEQLHDALDEVEDKRAIQRILAAISYNDGVTQQTLADRHGVSRRTTYSWMDRFSAESLEPTTIARAATDEGRPGRPRRLSTEQQNKLEQQLHEPPTEVAIDAPAWTPTLLQQHLRDTFDVEYSRPSCRRLLKEAGLTYQKPRHPAAEAEAEKREEFTEERQQNGGRWMPRSLYRSDQAICPR
jgi:transposase